MKLSYEIKRFRSISNKINITLLSNKLNIILGTNGSGKSNILESIKWFSGNALIDESNIKTLKTEYHPDYNPFSPTLDDPEIIFYDDLDTSEVERVNWLLEEVDIFLEKENFQRTFRRYKDSFYLDYHVNEKGLTDISEIKFAIYSKFADLWPAGIFIEEEEKGIKYWVLVNNKSEENFLIEIKNSTKKGLTATIKEKLTNAIKNLFEIDSIFKKRPNIMSSSNLENDNNILFEYPILSIKEGNIDPTFKKILDMIGDNCEKDLEKIIDLSTGTEQNRTIIRSLKDNFCLKSKKVIEKIFKDFSIDLIPQVVIDDQKFQIVIKGTNVRQYINNHPKSQSSGYKSFLWFIIMFEILKTWNAKKYGSSILIVDEPDKSLHILLQYELAIYLQKNISEININAYILFTTHSPFIVPNLEENIYISKISNEGTTTLIPAKDINNIRDSNIFPLISLYYMQKLKKDLYPELENKDSIRLYCKTLENIDIKNKVESFLTETIGKKIDFVLVEVDNNESNYIQSIRTESFFSFHVSTINELHELIAKNGSEYNKDIFIPEKIIEEILNNDTIS